MKLAPRIAFTLLLLLLLSIPSVRPSDKWVQRHHKHCDDILHSSVRNDTLERINMTHYDALLRPLFLQTSKLDRNIEGGTFDSVVEKQRKLYYSVASNTRCIKTICEIGFNSGSSALIWLLANPRARVVMFDIWAHNYAPVGEAYLRSLRELNATDRLVIIRGSSLQTVPEFARNVSGSGFVCDLLSVDGSHRHDDAVQDIQNMFQIASPVWSALLVDDTNCAYKYCVDGAIREHFRRGTIHLVKALSLDEGRRGVSLFKYAHNKTAALRHFLDHHIRLDEQHHPGAWR